MSENANSAAEQNRKFGLPEDYEASNAIWGIFQKIAQSRNADSGFTADDYFQKLRILASTLNRPEDSGTDPDLDPDCSLTLNDIHWLLMTLEAPSGGVIALPVPETPTLPPMPAIPADVEATVAEETGSTHDAAAAAGTPETYNENMFYRDLLRLDHFTADQLVNAVSMSLTDTNETSESDFNRITEALQLAWRALAFGPEGANGRTVESILGERNNGLLRELGMALGEINGSGYDSRTQRKLAATRLTADHIEEILSGCHITVDRTPPVGSAEARVRNMASSPARADRPSPPDYSPPPFSGGSSRPAAPSPFGAGFELDDPLDPPIPPRPRIPDTIVNDEEEFDFDRVGYPGDTEIGPPQRQRYTGGRLNWRQPQAARRTDTLEDSKQLTPYFVDDEFIPHTYRLATNRKSPEAIIEDAIQLWLGIKNWDNTRNTQPSLHAIRVLHNVLTNEAEDDQILIGDMERIARGEVVDPQISQPDAEFILFAYRRNMEARVATQTDTPDPEIASAISRWTNELGNNYPTKVALLLLQRLMSPHGLDIRSDLQKLRDIYNNKLVDPERQIGRDDAVFILYVLQEPVSDRAARKGRPFKLPKQYNRAGYGSTSALSRLHEQRAADPRRRLVSGMEELEKSERKQQTLWFFLADMAKLRGMGSDSYAHLMNALQEGLTAPQLEARYPGLTPDDYPGLLAALGESSGPIPDYVRNQPYIMHILGLAVLQPETLIGAEANFNAIAQVNMQRRGEAREAEKQQAEGKRDEIQKEVDRAIQARHTMEDKFINAVIHRRMLRGAKKKLSAEQIRHLLRLLANDFISNPADRGKMPWYSNKMLAAWRGKTAVWDQPSLRKRKPVRAVAQGTYNLTVAPLHWLVTLPFSGSRRHIGEFMWGRQRPDAREANPHAKVSINLLPGGGIDEPSPAPFSNRTEADTHKENSYGNLTKIYQEEIRPAFEEMLRAANFEDDPQGEQEWIAQILTEMNNTIANDYFLWAESRSDASLKRKLARYSKFVGAVSKHTQTIEALEAGSSAASAVPVIGSFIGPTVTVLPALAGLMYTMPPARDWVRVGAVATIDIAAGLALDALAALATASVVGAPVGWTINFVVKPAVDYSLQVTGTTVQQITRRGHAVRGAYNRRILGNSGSKVRRRNDVKALTKLSRQAGKDLVKAEGATIKGLFSALGVKFLGEGIKKVPMLKYMAPLGTKVLELWKGDKKEEKEKPKKLYGAARRRELLALPPAKKEEE